MIPEKVGGSTGISAIQGERFLYMPSSQDITCISHEFTQGWFLSRVILIKDLIDKHGVKFVLDLHGAALYSPFLDTDQTIDLGTRQNKQSDSPSMDIAHVEVLEKNLCGLPKNCDPANFVVLLARDRTLLRKVASHAAQEHTTHRGSHPNPAMFDRGSPVRRADE